MVSVMKFIVSVNFSLHEILEIHFSNCDLRHKSLEITKSPTQTINDIIFYLIIFPILKRFLDFSTKRDNLQLYELDANLLRDPRATISNIGN